MGPPTLGSIDPAKTELWGNCLNRSPPCGHGAPLDLTALVYRFGANTPAIDLNKLLRCKVCGHRGGKISLSPRNTGPSQD